MLTCVICFSILSLCSVRVCMLCAENAGPICVSHWIQHADSNKWNNNIESTQSAKPTRNGNKKNNKSGEYERLFFIFRLRFVFASVVSVPISVAVIVVFLIFRHWSMLPLRSRSHILPLSPAYGVALSFMQI